MACLINLMREPLCLAIALASLSTISSAQTITETFGTGANAFSMEFVQIGNPGNAADTSGEPNPAGSVSYIYNLGKYEISRDIIQKANLGGSLGITMYDMTYYGGNGGNKPATGISWLEAVKVVNYLNSSTGNPLAYKIDGSGNFQAWTPGDVGYNSTNTFRNSLAKYFLPSADEWYKGAYGSPQGVWYDYANASNSIPSAIAGGTSQSSVVWHGQTGPAEIDQAGGLSEWGTMAQSGNVWEWNETIFNIDVFRTIRGGSWATDFFMLASNYSNFVDPIMPDELASGFRVAMVPEPSSLSLLALGAMVVVLGRRRK